MKSTIEYPIAGLALITLGVLLSCIAANHRRSKPSLSHGFNVRFIRPYAIGFLLSCGLVAFVLAWGALVGTLLALNSWMLANISIPALLALRKS